MKRLGSFSQLQRSELGTLGRIMKDVRGWFRTQKFSGRFPFLELRESSSPSATAGSKGVGGKACPAGAEGRSGPVAEAIPRFLVREDSRYQGLREAWTALRTPTPRAWAVPHGFSWAPVPPPHPPHDQGRRAFLSSALLHFATLVFVLRVPAPLFLSHPVSAMSPPPTVYQLRALDLTPYLPALARRGLGGRPGRGIRPEKTPALGSTAFHPRLTLLSVPLRSDNRRQTIVQPATPPELKLPVELRLPNVVIAADQPLPRAPVEFRLDARVGGELNKDHPAPTSVPLAPSHSPPLELALASTPSLNPLPRLAVASPPLPLPRQAPEAKFTPGPSGLGARSSNEASAGVLIVLGIDPGPLSGTIQLPPGNRYGEFSISPAGPGPGSPGGVPGGDAMGGSGEGTTGGDGSSGVGGGSSGGGGSAAASAGGAPVTIAGSELGGAGLDDRDGSRGVLPMLLPRTLVYPVRPAPRPRRRSLYVTTGPMGGGGLRVYGVLRGGKIYTIYLPMTGKNWILQFCRRQKSSATPPRSTGRTARLDYGLVPPSPDKQFDFHRLPVPEDKADEFIVLQGVIREDGSVDELRVLESIEAISDQAAVAAFSRWKFQPALEAGKPVEVDILVGIPATIPEESEKRAAKSSGDS